MGKEERGKNLFKRGEELDSLGGSFDCLPRFFFKGGHRDPYFVLIFCISSDGFTIQTSRNDGESTRQ